MVDPQTPAARTWQRSVMSQISVNTRSKQSVHRFAPGATDPSLFDRCARDVHLDKTRRVDWTYPPRLWIDPCWHVLTWRCTEDETTRGLTRVELSS